MKKALKTILCLTLCLSLCLSAAPALATRVAVTAESVGEEDQAIAGAAAIGDTLYYCTQSAGGATFYSRKADDPAVTVLGSTVDLAQEPENFTINALFAWNDQLYALNCLDGLYFSLLSPEGALAPALQQPTLDTSAFVEKDGDSSYMSSLTGLFTLGDYLYYTCQSYAQGYAALAGRIDLKSGANQTFQTGSIMSLAPYEDGKLVAYIFDAAAMYGTGTASAQDALQQAGICAIFDPETDTLGQSYPIETDSILGGMTIGGLCYGGGSVYFGSGSRIMGIDMATGQTRISGYTGEGLYGGSISGSLVLYAAGYYVTYGYSGLQLYLLDGPNLSKGALRIYGEFGSTAHKSFVKNYPDIPVEVAGDYTSSLEALTQAMVTENDPYDVLLLSLNYMPVDRLLKKGYCADLSGDAELQELVKQMYPAFGEILQKDGKLYGIPTEVSAYAFGVDMEKWEELGLTEEDLPTNYVDLMDFAANWVYDYGEDHPDIALFNYGQSSQMLFSLMLGDYLAYTQLKGENTLFDTPVYRQLLKAFEAVDFTEIDSLIEGDSMYVGDGKALFSMYTPVVPMNYYDKNITPLYLAMTPEEEPFLAAQVSVMIVNPKTTRMESAMLYVKNYLRNLPKDGANITLFPDHNDAVENSYYKQSLEALNTELEKAQERLNTVAAENKAEVKDSIDSLTQQIAEVEANRYSVTPEQIQNYRDVIFPMLFLQRQNILYSADNKALTEINTLMMQYLEKAIDSDRMITELDNRLRLMALEDN